MVNSTRVNQILTLDLNADLGEGGLYDAELLQLITSANIACGAHAGDSETMKRTILAAKHNQIRIGAHPSFPDRENFGRKSMDIPSDTLYQSLYQQITLLAELCHQQALKIDYIKPHGALYNLAAEDKTLADLIIKLITRLKAEALSNQITGINHNLKLMMLAESSCCSWAKEAGIEIINEAFADRRYIKSQTSKAILCPRTLPGAMIEDLELVIAQVKQLNSHQAIQTLEGDHLIINTESICIHGDGPQALIFAKAIANVLTHSDG